ncbi:uncharacterized protein [Primulina huaijiensis]|uniref:uncharacterized protein n=1 Tax=Primulina huaijiensis TaxID=1492673 RepID=UPI003CC73DD6
MAASPPLILLTSLLLLSSTQSHSLFFSNYRILVSLSHSLASRVATLRDARGDVLGAARARNLARIIERGMGLGFYKLVFNVGWDFLKNFAWSDTMSFGTLAAVLPDLKELLAAVGDFNRINSDAGRVAWIGRNYGNVLRVSKSLFARLLKVFGQSGSTRELLEALQNEVLEGDLLKDCLELGANDLQGLIQVFKDIVSQYAYASTKTEL